MSISTMSCFAEKWTLGGNFQCELDENSGLLITGKNGEWSMAGEYLLPQTYAMNVAAANSELQCDSIVVKWDDGTPISKTIRKYDERGNMTLSEIYNWDDTGNKWKGTSKDTQEYNSTDQRINYFSFLWDEEKAVWVNSSKTETTYRGSSDLILTSNSYTWHDGSWLTLSTTENSYTDAGERLEGTTLRYDYYSGSVHAGEKYVWTYDANTTSIVSYNWNRGVGDWVNNSKSVTTLNEQSRTKEDIYCEWNSTNGDWDNIHRTVTTTDEQGREIKYINYEWNGSGDWQYTSISDYTYEGTGYSQPKTIIATTPSGNSSQWECADWNPVLKMYKSQKYYTWDKDENDWVLSNNSVSDDNGNTLLVEQYMKSDMFNNQWGLNYRYTYEYDANGNLLKSEETSHNSFLGYLYIKCEYSYSSDKLSNIHRYASLDGESWLLNHITYYYYYNASSINKPQATDLVLYPNPANDFIIIRDTSGRADIQLSIYDAKGILVLQQKVEPNEPVSINRLTKGIYIYRITTDGKAYSGKLTKQ